MDKIFYVVETGSKKAPIKVYGNSCATHYSIYRDLMWDYSGERDLIVIENLTGIAKRFIAEFDNNNAPKRVICLSNDYKGYLYDIFG